MGDALFWILVAVAVLLDVGLVTWTWRAIRRRMGPPFDFQTWHQVTFAACGCCSLVAMLVAIPPSLFLIGVVNFTVAEGMPKTPPPPEFVGLWNGDDKSILLIGSDGVASYRNGARKVIDHCTGSGADDECGPPYPGATCVRGAWEVDAGRVHVNLAARSMSVTQFRIGIHFRIGPRIDADRLVLSGVVFRRAVPYSTGEFAKGDDPS
jgi:hypothetical protein